MPITQATWLAAQASIAAAITKPYLSAEEKSVGQRYSVELDEAIRLYRAYFSEIQNGNDAKRYQDALSAYQTQLVATARTVAYAERVARAAQVALGFSFSGGMPWENTPYAPLPATYANVPKIIDRIQNIWEAGAPYTSDAYLIDVANPLISRLSQIGDGGPIRPTPPGQTTLVVLPGANPAEVATAEAALTAVIAKCSRFAAAAAVQ